MGSRSLARRSKWNPFSNTALLVTKESAVRYFKGRAIPNSDHWNICTPRVTTDLVHQYLFDFLRENNVLPSRESETAVPGHPGVTNVGDRGLLKKSDSALPTDTPLSYKERSKTVSNPRYSDDLLKLDGLYDRRSVINAESVIIVVGTNVAAELLDRPVAEQLRDRIDSEGGIFPFRRGVILTDQAWYAEQAFLAANPVIAVGGPNSNKLSDEFKKWAPPKQSGEGTYLISTSKKLTGFFRRNQRGLPQVGLWGDTGSAVGEAVDSYIANPKGLAEFLGMCWKSR
jgi:hypothetical protein